MRSVFGLAVGDKTQQQQLWKVLDDGVCDVKCPPANYTESLTDPHRCNKCDDSCPKGKNVSDFRSHHSTACMIASAPVSHTV